MQNTKKRENFKKVAREKTDYLPGRDKQATDIPLQQYREPGSKYFSATWNKQRKNLDPGKLSFKIQWERNTFLGKETLAGLFKRTAKNTLRRPLSLERENQTSNREQKKKKGKFGPDHSK